MSRDFNDIFEISEGSSDDVSHSGFWLDDDRFNKHVEGIKESKERDRIDLIRLASARRAISNFVGFMTDRPIPVYFRNKSKNFTFDGKAIYLSAELNEKKDFDVAVGLALHEAAHIVKTDFSLLLTLWKDIPQHIWKRFDSLNIPRRHSEKFIHAIWNIVEDRFIDDWVIHTAPGYVGYYDALYQRYFNDPLIDYGLTFSYSYPSLASYKFRITNFMNPKTDLYALPGLYDIAKEISISTISRLKAPQDRIDTALRVVEIILGNLIPDPDQADDCDDPEVSNFFEIDDSFEEDEEFENASDTKSIGTKAIEEIGEVLKGNTDPTEEPEDATIISEIGEDPMTKKDRKKLDKIIQAQDNFLTGNLDKETLTPEEVDILNIIESSGMTMVTVGGNNAAFKTDCIVVHKLTKQLITSGISTFPMSTFYVNDDGKEVGTEANQRAIEKGIRIGKKLGSLLKIRNEIFDEKWIRKSSGTLNKRLLHEAAWDSEQLFIKIQKKEFAKAAIHISVDASTSMTMANKWEEALTCCVAICKATSMVGNIHTVVTFRTTHKEESKAGVLPYVVVAYDSAVDPFSKIQDLFPMLYPNGWTPEGLAFEALSKISEMYHADEHDRYFINFSDGQPYMPLRTETGKSHMYANNPAVEHTRTEVSKIRRKNVKVLSYFIKTDESEFSSFFGGNTEVGTLKRDFQNMYGKDASFIDVRQVVPLATTINKLFIRRK